jgi:hypothetical protein
MHQHHSERDFIGEDNVVKGRIDLRVPRGVTDDTSVNKCTPLRFVSLCRADRWRQACRAAEV